MAVVTVAAVTSVGRAVWCGSCDCSNVNDCLVGCNCSDNLNCSGGCHCINDCDWQLL